MYICVCIYMYVHLCTYMHLSMYVLVHTFVCIKVIYLLVLKIFKFLPLGLALLFGEYPSIHFQNPKFEYNHWNKILYSGNKNQPR